MKMKWGNTKNQSGSTKKLDTSYLEKSTSQKATSQTLDLVVFFMPLRCQGMDAAVHHRQGTKGVGNTPTCKHISSIGTCELLAVENGLTCLYCVVQDLSAPRCTLYSSGRSLPQAVVKSVRAPGSASRYHSGPDAGEGLLYPSLLLFLVHDELRRLHVRRVDVQVRGELNGKEGAPANAAAALTEKLKIFIETNFDFQGS